MNFYENDEKCFYLSSDTNKCNFEVEYDPPIKFNQPMECALGELIIPKILDIDYDLYVTIKFKWIEEDEISSMFGNFPAETKKYIKNYYCQEKRDYNYNKIKNQTFKIIHNATNNWFDNLKKIVDNYNQNIENYIKNKYEDIQSNPEYPPWPFNPRDWFNQNELRCSINNPSISYNKETKKYIISNGNFFILPSRDFNIVEDKPDYIPDVRYDKKSFLHFRGVIYFEFSEQLKKLLGLNNYTNENIIDTINFMKIKDETLRNYNVQVDNLNPNATDEEKLIAKHSSIIQKFISLDCPPINVYNSDITPIASNRKINYFNIFCDIISDSYYNNKKLQILNVIPANKIDNEEYMKFKFNKKHFVPLKYHEFNSIKITILDDENNSLLLRKGNVIVVLIIRPKHFM